MSFSETLVYSSILALNNGQKLTADQIEAIQAFLGAQAPATAPATAPTTPVAKKPRSKAKIAVAAPAPSPDEEALLAPVDAPAPAPVTATPTGLYVDAADYLHTHKYRLQSIDSARCLGRKIDEKNPIVGTRKEDEGSNGMFWPEKQCTKPALAGALLCKFCSEKCDDVKAGKPAHKQWYGRLDEPMYGRAMIIGCGHYNAKYPHGIPSDPSTAAPAAVTPAPKKAAATTAATATAAKKTPAAPKKASTTTAKTAAGAGVQETVASTEQSAVEAEWAIFFHNTRPVIRNLKTNLVYEVDQNKPDYEEMVQRDKCLGRWTEDGTIDPYGADSAE